MKPIKLESTYCIQVEIGDIPDFAALKHNKKTKYKNSFKNNNNVPSYSINQDLFHIMRRCRRSQQQQHVLISHMSDPMRKRLFFRRNNKVKIAADLIAPVSIVSSPMLSYPLPNHLETYRKASAARSVDPFPNLKSNKRGNRKISPTRKSDPLISNFI